MVPVAPPHLPSFPLSALLLPVPVLLPAFPVLLPAFPLPSGAGVLAEGLDLFSVIQAHDWHPSLMCILPKVTCQVQALN